MRNGTLLAAIDLGSNSFRLEIGRYEHGQVQRIEYLKETVRQGNALDERRNLSPEAMQRGWECLSRFSSACSRSEKTTSVQQEVRLLLRPWYSTLLTLFPRCQQVAEFHSAACQVMMRSLL